MTSTWGCALNFGTLIIPSIVLDAETCMLDSISMKVYDRHTEDVPLHYPEQPHRYCLAALFPVHHLQSTVASGSLLGSEGLGKLDSPVVEAHGQLELRPQPLSKTQLRWASEQSPFARDERVGSRGRYVISSLGCFRPKTCPKRHPFFLYFVQYDILYTLLSRMGQATI
jgi:hypothetical protein